MIQNNLEIMERLKAIEDAIGIHQMMTQNQMEALKLSAEILKKSNSDKSPLDFYYDIRKLVEMYGVERVLEEIRRLKV